MRNSRKQKIGISYGMQMDPDFSKSLQDTNSLKSLLIRQAALAYMDDTTWIARSKQDMDHILERAKWFYAANDSQINGNKSILITINSKNKMPNKVRIGVNQEEVVELDRKQHI